MKRTLSTLYAAGRGAWRRNPVLRWFSCAAVPALVLCLLLGGWPCVMLASGYLQIAWKALLPGEMVEISPQQRAAIFAGGFTRMLFFTGMMTHADWPFLLMAEAHILCLLFLYRGERIGLDMSPLPLLASAGFLALGLMMGARLPSVQIALSAALSLTLIRLLIRRKHTMRQLAMRFHLA